MLTVVVIIKIFLKMISLTKILCIVQQIRCSSKCSSRPAIQCVYLTPVAAGVVYFGGGETNETSRHHPPPASWSALHLPYLLLRIPRGFLLSGFPQPVANTIASSLGQSGRRTQVLIGREENH